MKTNQFNHISFRVLSLMLLLAATPAMAETRYVKGTASGSGDGSSWANASADLQAMIQASVSGDAVWVAEGTYKPTNKPYNGGVELSSTDERDKTFHLKDGVHLFGGFEGTETALSQRNWTAHPTILSGDIGAVGTNTDNCYHVVVAVLAASGGVTMDGFTIQDGNANGITFLTVNGIILSSNFGGGVWLFSGTNTLANNTFSSNSASESGGGICSDGSKNTLTNNLFSANSANSGGGVRFARGTNTLTNNTFSSNSARASGGGFFDNSSINTLTNNTFLSNSALALDGGGAFFSSLDIITNNTLTNNTFSSNSANFRGGGVWFSTNRAGTNTLTNNTFSSNSAISRGGGFYSLLGVNVMTNNIFWGNQLNNNSTTAGADYEARDGSGNLFKNNLLQLVQSTYSVSDSRSFYYIGASASNNLFAQDPLFVNASDIDGADNIHRTPDDGLRLQVGSPCINVGNAAAWTATGLTTDAAGTTRPDGIVDLGAYEVNLPPLNDDCASATVVTVHNSCTNLAQGTTDGATLSQEGCVGTADDDVWYQFVATGTAHKITIGNPSKDVVLQVFEGSCAQLQSLACKNDSETTEILELSGLVVGQTYFIRVYSYHPAEVATFTVCVQNACAIPSNLATSNITATSAKLTWGVAANAIGYRGWYRVVGAATWTPLSSTTPTLTLIRLTPNTNYEAYIETQCNPAGTSDPSEVVRFKTLPPFCTRITAAPTVANLTSTTATINWAIATLTRNYLVQYKRTAETVWTEQTVSTNTLGLIGLLPSTSYTVRIVKNCTNGGISDPSPEKLFTTAAPCEPPATTVPTINYANATVRWNALTGVSGYEVRYKVQTAANWVTPTKTATATATSVLLTGLLPGKTYEYQIRLKCRTTTFSAYSESRTFTTPTCVAVVPSVRTVTQTSITVQWTPMTSVAGYEVHFRKVGVATWTIRSVGVAASSFNIIGLVKATNYEIRMVTKCVAANGNSDFSPTIQAVTAGAVARPESSEASAETGLKIQVSPNPTTGNVFLYVTSPERGMGRWMLRDYLGRMVMHQDGLETEAGEQMYSIDLTHLNAGMYVLQWVQGDILRTQTILLQR